MKRILLSLAIATAMPAAESVHEFTMKSIDGSSTPLSKFKGKPVLLVNVASQCGYTPQYKGLEAVYRKYSGKGFVIVGVPANNFGAQEPGTNEEIQTFCKRSYDVTFPLLAKVSVKGADIAPLYEYLTAETKGPIKWNFTKILVGKDGKVIARFEPNVEPESSELTSAIERALQ